MICGPATPTSPEYLQAVEEFLEPLSPVIDSDPRYEQQNIVGRMASRSA